MQYKIKHYIFNYFFTKVGKKDKFTFCSHHRPPEKPQLKQQEKIVIVVYIEILS